MIFTEGRFFVFFLAVFAVYWSLRSNRARKAFLLVCSYVFYSAWDWRFLSLILFTTVLDYGVGLMLGRTEDPRRRKAWLGVSLLGNLGLLGFFKYYNFFVENGARLLEWLGLGAHDWTLRIILPVGISFYTFQTLSYSIDVYRRHIPPTRSLLDFSLFVAFFPQIFAGPIVRAAQFLPMLTEKRVWSAVNPRAALSLFLIGYFKKACVADNAAQVADMVFSDPGAYTMGSTWLGLFLYGIQIYCDFSGYSDMAISSAALLGYRLPDNFNFPSFASSIPDFWRRWHISLSTWVRDYVYVSLAAGGRGRRKLRLTLRDYYVTMVLIGLWHGAAWTFVLFGVVHGTLLAVYHLFKVYVPYKSRAAHFFGALGVPLTYFTVGISLLLFRSATVRDALGIGRALVGVDAGTKTLDPGWLAFYVCCAAVHWISYKQYVNRFFSRLPLWLWSFVYGALWALALPFVSTGYSPFIYFRF